MTLFETTCALKFFVVNLRDADGGPGAVTVPAGTIVTKNEFTSRLGHYFRPGLVVCVFEGPYKGRVRLVGQNETRVISALELLARESE